MELIRSVDALPAGLRFVLVIGMFDGLHRGHLRVLDAHVAASRDLDATPVLLTFEPHPERVLRGAAPLLLCDPDERLMRFADRGVGITVLQPFDHAFASQPADAFVQRVAHGRDLAALVMTPESAFGRDREGTLAALRALSGRAGFRVTEVPQLELRGGRVSASRIRDLIERGRLSDAGVLLGRPYAVVGSVVRGDGRGRALGYPTANLAFAEPVALPPDGVYAVRAGWGGGDVLQPAHRAQGVASLGVRPTFGGGERVLEVHLLDFDADLYGQRIRVEFVRRQRGQRRFASAGALIAQMQRDAVRSRAILSSG